MIDPGGRVLEEFDGRLEAGRGMQFQAEALERLVATGRLEDELLTPADTVSIMETLDEVRAQIGLRYPGE